MKMDCLLRQELLRRCRLEVEKVILEVRLD